MQDIYRIFSDYYYNPSEDRHLQPQYDDIESDINTCLRSLPVIDKIKAACNKGYSYITMREMIREFAVLGKNGVSMAGQRTVAETLGISTTTVQKYYRRAVQAGIMYCNHRTRMTAKGSRRTTNKTIITIFIEYAERCKQFIKSAKKKASSLIPPEVGRIVFNTVPDQNSDTFSNKIRTKPDKWMLDFKNELSCSS